jgi:hypothetical protein
MLKNQNWFSIKSSDGLSGTRFRFHKRRGFLDHLSDYKLLKLGFTP